MAITFHSSTPELTENSKAIFHNNEPSIMPNLEPYYSHSSFIPLPGFSREQLLVVDRIRDQVHVLTKELQEARKQLDIFINDVKIHEQSEKPKSLASAQIEYSIKKLLIDTEEARETLAQKDIALRQIEDKNRELQKKVDKFTSTANLLAEERKNSINLSNEEKLDFDRKIAQTHSELTRIQSEREDVARHLSTVKRLLEVADQDIKNEKQKLKVSLIEFQTNKSKVAIDEEKYTEESSRVKILESKIITLGDQLRSVSEEVRIKESQLDETRKKIENDKLHYTQLLEDERSKAAADIRELRQELIDELATRDRRYQEERQRVIHDSFERGRIQGIEDGQSEALLEADAVTQELTITVQRHKAEVNAMRIRLRSAMEQSEADERRLNSQVVALQETLHNLHVGNSQMETENDSLMTAKEELEEEIFHNIRSAVAQTSQPIGRSDLLAVIHALRINKKVNYAFEVQRAEEREKNMEQEQKEVCEWVTASVGGTCVPFPPMRMLYASEPPVNFESESNLWNQPEIPNELLESKFQDVIESQEALVRFDPDEMDRRYRELLSELTKVRADIGLLPQKSSSSEQHILLAYEELAQSENGKMCPDKFENQTSLDKTEGFLPPEENEQQSFIPTPQEVPYHHGELVSPQQSDVRQTVYPESVSVAPENKEEYFPESVPDGDTHSKREETKTECQSDPAPFKKSFSTTNSQKQVNQIASPPTRRGIPTRIKRLTLSDSDSDNDFPILEKEELKRGVPRRGPPKRSLFDDSDSSDF
ncbi:hypothetical protein LSM04_004647 [Trypanosoma melophagium]|uniref:uncharacterized protein n=1 Tax=Trypanosoma melophagium TaxID=715481 RepID=UPI00351A7D22|nr:hypothetical protein LSM04_004647 [Trypanosoma melophagium]